MSQRRGNDMFSNISNLNAIPSEYDLSLHPNNYGIDPDIDLFTNPSFFDVETSDGPLTGHSQVGSQGQGPAFDFASLSDFEAIPQVSEQPSYTQQYPTFGYQDPIALVPGSAPLPIDSDKLDLDTSSNQLDVGGDEGSVDEPSHAAAEEDKRRRNTAASARFRVKKKQREQAMEKTAKDMTDRVTFLENRVGQLEMENKLLKDLITEKSGGNESLLETTAKRVASENEARAKRVKVEQATR